MDAVKALDYAIFALNTFLEPQASSDTDMADLDENAREAATTLCDLRDQMRKRTTTTERHIREALAVGNAHTGLDIEIDETFG